MTKQLIDDSYMEVFKTKLPTLIKDINSGSIRKYTKHGIFEPDEEDKIFISKMNANNIKVLTIIESYMYYMDKKLDVINYVYLSPKYKPASSIKGIKVEALVKNKTWNITSNGIICIDEINGNLIRVQ